MWDFQNPTVQLTCEPLEMPAHRKFTHSLQWYAQQYGISASKAKRLSLAGVNLDDPNAMSAFRADKRPRNNTRENKRRMPTRPEPIVNQSDPLRTEIEKHIGMSAGIKRLQAVEVLLALDYENARRSRDMERAKACCEEWLAVFEQLRRVEATNPEVERLKKELVLISEVEVELSKLHGKIYTMLDALPDRLTHRLMGLKATAIRSELFQEAATL